MNPALCAFWTIVTNEGEWLARKTEAFHPTLSAFLAAREALGDAETSPCAGDLDLAWAAFVVNRCSRSGMIGAAVGPIGGMNQSGARDVASRWNGPALAGRIRWAHEQATSGRLRFLPGDAVAAVEGLTGSGIEEEVFVFLDPPYVREGKRLYANAFCERDRGFCAARAPSFRAGVAASGWAVLVLDVGAQDRQGCSADGASEVGA